MEKEIKLTLKAYGTIKNLTKEIELDGHPKDALVAMMALNRELLQSLSQCVLKLIKEHKDFENAEKIINGPVEIFSENLLEMIKLVQEENREAAKNLKAEN